MFFLSKIVRFRWWVPISYAVPGGDFNNTKNSIWLSPEESTRVAKMFENVDPAKPVVVNVQQTGFFRLA